MSEYGSKVVLTMLVVLSLCLTACARTPKTPAKDRNEATVKLVSQVLSRSLVPTASAISDDGRLVLVGERSGAVDVIDISRQKLLGRLQPHQAETIALRFMNGTRTAWSLGRDGALCLLDLPRRSVIDCGTVPPARESVSAAISPGAALVALVGLAGTVSLWDTKRGEAVSNVSLDTNCDSPLSGKGALQGFTRFCAIGFEASDALVTSGKGGTSRFDYATKKQDKLDIPDTFDGPSPSGPYDDPESESVKSRPRVVNNVAFVVPLANGALLRSENGMVGSASSGHGVTAVGNADLIGASTNGQYGILITKEERSLNIERIDGTLANQSYLQAKLPLVQVGAIAMTGDSVALIASGAQVWAIDWSTLAVHPVRASGSDVIRMSSNGRLFSSGHDSHFGISIFDLGDRAVSSEEPATDGLLACALQVPGCKLMTFGPPDGKPEYERLAEARVREIRFLDPVSRRESWKLRDVDSCSERQPYEAYEGSCLNQKAISADGRRAAFAATLSRDRHVVRIVNAATGQIAGTLKMPLGVVPSALALSDDGRRLLLSGSAGHTGLASFLTPPPRVQLFDVDSGSEISAIDAMPDGVGALAFSADGRFALVGGANMRSASVGDPNSELWVVSLESLRVERRLRGHSDGVSSAMFSPNGDFAVSASQDGTVRIWPLADSSRTPAPVDLGDERQTVGRPLTLLLSETDWLMYDDRGRFDASRNGIAFAAASRGTEAFSLDQLAPRDNRPDVLLADLGFGNTDAFKHFHHRFTRRLEDLGLSEQQVHEVERAPATKISSKRVDGKFVELDLEFSSQQGELGSFDIFINGIAAIADKSISGQRARVTERVELSVGNNRIVAQARRSRDGLVGLRDVEEVMYQGHVKKKLFYVGIGVSNYVSADLRSGVSYAHSDVTELGSIFQRAQSALFTEAPSIEVVPEQDVTPTRLEQLSEFLAPATIDDTVVIALAGHGRHRHDASADYEFLTYDGRPVALSVFQKVMSSTRARERLLLVDTCESGDEIGAPSAVAERAPMAWDGSWGARDRYIYQDLKLHSGFVVFAAARGFESAGESHRTKHGHFTGAVIEALSSGHETDSDSITIEDLRRSVVWKVTHDNPAQHPTIDRDNREQDFRLPRLKSSPQ